MRTGVVWLLTTALVVAAGAARRGGSPYGPPGIGSITIGPGFRYLDNYSANPSHYITGDTFATTWADNGTTYITCNDCSLPDSDFTSTVQNIGVNTMAFSTASAPGIGNPILTLAAGNGIKQWSNYNGAASDSRNFKSSGLLCLPGTPHGVFYLNTRRYNPATGSGDPMSYTQIITSTDYANSWSPTPPGTLPSNQPYNPAMFQTMGDNTIGGYFQYGQCYAGAGPDNSSNFVYAFVLNSGPITTSPNWNYEWLARVPIGSIGNLSASDWQFYKGPVGAADGGTNVNYWFTPFSTSTATMMINGVSQGLTELCCSQDAVYLPRYQQYLHITADGAAPSALRFWTSPHPWGPWTLTGTGSDQNGFPSPVISSLGNGGQTLWVVSSGDPGTGQNPGSSTTTYTMYVYQMTIWP